MKAAITTLEIALKTMETNEPINRKEGKEEQADLEATNAADIRQALAVLRASDAGPIRPAMKTETKPDSGVNPEYALSCVLVKALMRCPECGEPVDFISLRGAESKLDHIELTVVCDNCNFWRHKLFTEEI